MMKARQLRKGCLTLTLWSSASFAQIAISQDDATRIAREAYLYAYPLVLMDVTRQVATNVATPQYMRAPTNQLVSARQFPDSSFTDVVRPNADTLYTTIEYDVSKEPLIMHVPDSRGRYYLLEWMDAWSDVYTVPGSRTTGGDEQTFAIVGPDWHGALPPGVTEYRSPTTWGLLIGRTETNGPSDYPAVHAFQDGMSAVPLSTYGKSYTPPPGTVDPKLDMSSPVKQVEKMDGETFFTTFAQLLQSTAPHANDYPLLDQMARIGIQRGKPFSFAAVPKVVQDALKAAPAAGLAAIKHQSETAGTVANGWRTNLVDIGTYGTDYLQRATVAQMGLGANVVEDAIYPFATQDSEGHPLDSGKHYVMHFAKHELPPVNGFWSLTMYDSRQLFAANPINRYALGDRDSLVYNADGSLDLYIQRESPGKNKEANWLPTPQEGSFSMNLRLYWPKAPASNGTWKAPQVKLLH